MEIELCNLKLEMHVICRYRRILNTIFKIIKYVYNLSEKLSEQKCLYSISLFDKSFLLLQDSVSHFKIDRNGVISVNVLDKRLFC